MGFSRGSPGFIRNTPLGNRAGPSDFRSRVHVPRTDVWRAPGMRDTWCTNEPPRAPKGNVTKDSLPPEKKRQSPKPPKSYVYMTYTPAKTNSKGLRRPLTCIHHIRPLNRSISATARRTNKIPPSESTRQCTEVLCLFLVMPMAICCSLLLVSSPAHSAKLDKAFTRVGHSWPWDRSTWAVARIAEQPLFSLRLLHLAQDGVYFCFVSSVAKTMIHCLF